MFFMDKWDKFRIKKSFRTVTLGLLFKTVIMKDPTIELRLNFYM
jgi:hypothetical protein